MTVALMVQMAEVVGYSEARGPSPGTAQHVATRLLPHSCSLLLLPRKGASLCTSR